MQVNKKYSQLKAMLALTKASFIAMLRSPSSLAFGIIFPLVFILAFGFIGSSIFSIGVAVDPSSDINNSIYDNLKNARGIKFRDYKDLEKVETDLQKGKLDAYINIQKNTAETGPDYNITVKTTTASPDKGIFFLLTLNEITDKANLSKATIPKPVAEIKIAEVRGRKFKTIDFILPGQLGFSILSTGVFATAFVFLSLRQTLVIKRFFATPVNKFFIVISEALSRLFFSMIGALVIILIGRYFFNFTLLNGIVTAINMLALSAIGLIVFMGFGFAISGIAKNENTIPPLANMITLPQFLLSGTFFSVDVFPTWLQYISRALPLTHLNDALRVVAFEGASLLDVKTEILILLGWGVVTYLIASRLFKWE